MCVGVCVCVSVCVGVFVVYGKVDCVIAGKRCANKCIWYGREFYKSASVSRCSNVLMCACDCDHLCVVFAETAPFSLKPNVQ